MDNPTGIVQSLTPGAEPRLALVSVDIASACPRCAAGKGCGAGLLAEARQSRQIEAIIAADSEIEHGDTVELALAPGNISRAAMLVYGVPLLAALLSAGLAYALRLSDLGAAAAALGGLAAGVLFSWHRCRQSHCLTHFTPTITKRLPVSGTSAGDAG